MNQISAMFYFQGVHTSPKGHVSSSGFVFGENLADRVVQRSISEENAEDGNASPDSTEQGNAGMLVVMQVC